MKGWASPLKRKIRSKVLEDMYFLFLFFVEFMYLFKYMIDYVGDMFFFLISVFGKSYFIGGFFPNEGLGT